MFPNKSQARSGVYMVESDEMLIVCRGLLECTKTDNTGHTEYLNTPLPFSKSLWDIDG